MKRWIIAGVVSLLWGVLAIFPAAYVAGAVERSWYPHDSDPVDFMIGGTFLAAWLVLWLLVTIGLAAWVIRSRRIA